MRNETRRRSLSRREVIGAVGAGGCALLAGCPSRNEVNSVEVQNETTAVRSVELLPGERRADFSNKIVVRSDVTYTVRVRVDGEKTQSGRWNVQDEEMLVRVRESGEELDAVFADGCPQRAYGSGPSVQVYNLTGAELATRLTVESADAPTTARRQGSRTRAPTVETRKPVALRRLVHAGRGGVHPTGALRGVVRREVLRRRAGPDESPGEHG
jgi:hypothetical protein